MQGGCFCLLTAFMSFFLNVSPKGPIIPTCSGGRTNVREGRTGEEYKVTLSSGTDLITVFFNFPT